MRAWYVSRTDALAEIAIEARAFVLADSSRNLELTCFSRV